MTKKMRYAAYAGVLTAFIICAGIVYVLCVFLNSLGFDAKELEENRQISTDMLSYLENKYPENFIVAGKIDDDTFQFYPSTNANLRFYVSTTNGSFDDNYNTIKDSDAIKVWIDSIMLNNYYCVVTAEEGLYDVTVLYCGKLNTSLFYYDCACPSFKANFYEVSTEDLFNVQTESSTQITSAVHTYTLSNNAGITTIEGLR